ncbi:hypothetical protein KIH74_34805 [Kineosporia sp. J2-2]|uniref:Uncharacterized protein n=1 Tax=Kineosporia corallincola TaxID=2835133 RepID=A0ABS5TTM8_9ACTN|nr:hypothetical protein [Kineosporia corallincola]MBT0774168.1 hypothetical protein [Kineosporia corallincola]
MADETYIPAPVSCDIHRIEHGEHRIAQYDAKTRQGPWANLCPDCFAEHGIGLGTGKGQRLVVGRRPQPQRAQKESQIRAAISAGDLAMAEDLLVELGDDPDLTPYL